MIDLFETARQLQMFCDRQGWRSCFIGGIAVQRWGEPRVTRDADLALLTGFGGEDAFIDTLLAAYSGRIENAREFARRYRVLLLSAPGGIGLDISLGALPFEESVVSRATAFSFGPGIEIQTCSAEDLVVLKLFASRPLDIRDAEGVVVRQGDHLDWRYIEEQLGPLADAKQDPEILRTLSRLRRQ
jgi:nucleotidyltransferase AbiEii toxin of type IV toxin-antitoxin system